MLSGWEAGVMDERQVGRWVEGSVTVSLASSYWDLPKRPPSFTFLTLWGPSQRCRPSSQATQPFVVEPGLNVTPESTSQIIALAL